jgi:predicted ester cyclase
VTPYKLYRGTPLGEFLGFPPMGRSFEIETVDVMRVVDGRITEHWGVANLLKLLTQIGVVEL